MKQTISARAVRGKQQQARGIRVESSNRENARYCLDLWDVGDTSVPKGILHGSKHHSRLIQDKIGTRIAEHDKLIIHFHKIFLRFNFCAQNVCNLAVYPHSTCLNKLFGATSTRNARARKIALQTHGKVIAGDNPSQNLIVRKLRRGHRATTQFFECELLKSFRFAW